MELKKIDFADSELLNISISYDTATLSIRLDDEKQSDITISCSGVVGLNNLIIWDDTNIMSLKIVEADKSSEYLKEVFKAYPHNINYGGRYLSSPIKDLQITLSNNTTFHIYCQEAIISNNN